MDHVRHYLRRIFFLACLLAMVCGALAGDVYAAGSTSAGTGQQTESLIDRRFRSRIEQNPATRRNYGKVLLAGSSTMQLWAKRKDNPISQYGMLNMSVAGSSSSAWLRWYKKAIVRYKPSIVVLYVGVSDGLSSKSRANRMAGNVKTLISALRKELPNAWIYYISTVVPPDKEDRLPNTMKYTKSANKKIETFCKSQRRVTYISIADKFKRKGKVNRKLFREDGLHPNEQGMKIWNQLVGKRVARQANRMGLKKVSQTG